MVQSLTSKLDRAGEATIYFSVGVLLQTLFFGVYTLLIFLSTRMLLERKLNTRVNRVMFGLTVFMYLMTAGYWVYSVADVVDRIQGLTSLGKNPSKIQPAHTLVTMWSPLFNSFMLLNYVISDGVVVWRAWIICLRSHRKYLWITVFFLVATSVQVLLIISFRIAGTAISPIDNIPTNIGIGRGIDILQVLTTFTSLSSNLAATAVVSATAWGHWKSIRSALSSTKTNSTRTNRILLLVVESGVLYCISALINLVATVVRLPHGTLGDIYTPVNVQIAGAYPSIVLLLVSTERSLNDSTFGGDSSSTGVFSSTAPSRPIYFAAPGSRSLATNNAVTPHVVNFATDSRPDSMVSDMSTEDEKAKYPRPLPRPPHAVDSMV
ncbi:hypothetical protein MIND_00082800 [Mycena indigotica]|uniref:Uncharacterized protein n=1 Tax=Mycena indigotica TaxID=2126181 RepID=A0A8H6TFC4_9AGAR|nr:uncharacterized protein MIND_00082800 [Mycena indigotica]KAF7315672.1 hypothetical protein MIND_00082800 [Mycena indigotica]